MRSNRILAAILVICLMVSVISPAAMAAGVSVENVVNGKNPGSATGNASNLTNDLVLSGKDAVNSGLNLRDDPMLQVGVQSSAVGEWAASLFEGEVDSSLLVSKVPACLEELQEAAKLFEKDEVVTAFVVMEDKPLAESYSASSLVSANEENRLLTKQNNVINTIEKVVLGGKSLDVRYQFTYLTNSFTINTEFGNLQKIAMLNGVKSVFVMPVYNAVATNVGVATPYTAPSGAMVGVNTLWTDLGFTGEGMKIAVIDTGLDLDHPSFGALDADMVAGNDNYLSTDDIAAVLTELNAYGKRSSITANTLYRSTKVPYAFNYVDNSLTADHGSDSMGDHGTHVSGIAAANKTEGTNVVGMAPDAQIIVMKVFGAAGGAYTDDIVAALEDAMTLGCDVANLSLGSPAGFSSTDTEIDLIYERLASQDIIATISAGNEGTSAYDNLWGLDLNRTDNPDNATVSSPATYANAFGIASAENAVVMTENITLADGSTVFYMNNVEALYGYEYAYPMEVLADWELEYVIVPNLGSYEDFFDADGNSIVEGKIAVIKRGELSFSEKIFNAEYAGAVGALIWNNNDEDDIFTFGMTTSDAEGYYPSIPSALITLADGEMMAAAEEKYMTVSSELAARYTVNGGQMSSFSSWGATTDLRLVPDITGIGGNVYSCYDGGGYGLMSGTSMSAPQMAGISALVMQYLYTLYPDAPEGTVSAMAEALLMSTADPIISNDSGVEASPRQQGAGLVNAVEAVTTQAYLTVDGGRPKAELGDSATGTFTFTFEINNMGSEAETYALSSSLLTEIAADAGVAYFMYEMDMPLSGSVEFSQDTVTVPAGDKVDVTVTITLSDADKAYFAEAWKNGGYVEGYVYLYNEEGASELNLPFMGFYGDWTDAPIFDTAYWYDNSFWGEMPVTGLPEGDEYYHVIWTNLSGSDWVLGFNPYSGYYMDEYGQIVYDPANNVISPNGDGALDGLDEIYLSLLRCAKNLTFTYSVNGEVMHRETLSNVGKTMYNSAYGQVVPFIYSWYGNGMYDFTDAEGNVLPTGTTVMLTIDAKLDYGTGGNNTIQIPIIIDNEKPELVSVSEAAGENGEKYLIVTASENHNLANVALLNPMGSRIYAQEYFASVDENGNYVAIFDVTGYGTEFTVALCDYAANEAYYSVTYTTGGENLPEMDTSKLYAYRLFDDHLYSDHMFGWVSMDKPAEDEPAYITVESDDYLEYAAIVAAEYVGGKIIAVDAVYNLVVMDPGLWNRKTIGNLGINVLDLTFDDSTDTMYALVKGENDWGDAYTALCTLDLMTGELTTLVDYGYYTSAPWAITDDDNGTIYAIQYNSGTMYTLDAENDYALTPVTDAEGNEVFFTDSNGSDLRPNYSQSMVYEDGKIYWAYFWNYYNYYLSSELITIDTADWTAQYNTFVSEAYDYDYNLVEYNPMTELVGLLTLTETDYRFPESTELTNLTMDRDSMILRLGENVTLTAMPTPWNFDLDGAEWTTSDPTVAVVDNGNVSTVGEGVATITARYGDFEATCTVTVVSINGNFYAYNYYSDDGYYGYMIDVDLGSMDYFLEAESPVDFMAGDYNGHDGYFYGYTEGGQFYRYDMTTGEAVKLGDALGAAPADMAYDYSTGYMYAITVDYNMGYTSISRVNLNNGQLMSVTALQYIYLATLACDAEGTLYAIDAYGYLYKMPTDEYGITDMQLVMEGLGENYYVQSMCYDHANDVLLWAYCEGSSIYWIDVNAETPYAISLGDPTETGMFEFVGLYTIPETIPELPDVAVEYVGAEDMVMMSGSVKYPNCTIMPLNATCQDIAWTSSDETVVSINADGALVAVAAGTATISGVLADEVGDQAHNVSFQVTVLPSADNIYGHVMTDVASMNGYYWTRLYAADPSDPDVLGYTEYTLFSEEYYNGKLYAYGYSTGNFELIVMDAQNYAIEYTIDMGEGFPFVYDMTYDYTTSTMYALAGADSTATDLYAVNMESGALTLLMETEEFFMSLAAGPDGKLYAMEQSQQETSDDGWWDPWAPVTYTNAMLYTIDPLEGTVELVGDTGLKTNMIASMAYDYDTGYLYWTPLYAEASYVSSLAIVDPATGEATSLGCIGEMGAQVCGLYIISDSFPEETDALHKVLVDPVKTSVSAGYNTVVTATVLPMSLDAEIVWTSSDESIATVDENGVVTGVSKGTVEITATVTYGDVTKSAACTVTVLPEGAAFLTYNVTDGGWAAIDRGDNTIVTNLTEGVDEAAVITIANVGSDVYGYDVNYQLFKLDTTTYERTNIGDGLGLDVDTENGYSFEVRGMAYDAANERMLVLGATLYYDEYWDEYSEIYGGCSIYTVDLTTGELEELFCMEEYAYVMAMAVDTNGTVYVYSTFMDYVSVVDLDNGTCMDLITLQRLEMSGDYECDYTMYYDEPTGLLYMLFTSNGRYYRMVTVDPALGKLTLCGNVGEVVRDGWYYVGDVFCGLVYLDTAEEELPVKIAGANMVLGNTLDMNFFVEKATLSGTDYYAEITHYAEDGINTITIPYELWDIRANYAVVTLEGMAARQMADEVEVVIYNADGTVASNVWNDSVRAYAMRILENQDAETKTMLVDMLNYGAAAQTYFEYNTDDLANNQLTDAQKAYATESVSCVDQRVKGERYFGTTLVLKNRILLTMYFQDITPDMYAMVSYTDHKGVAHDYRVEGSNFARYNANTYGVTVDDLVIADGDQLVTVTVYDASGNQVGSASDTINGYAMRMMETDPLFEMVAKFTTSAYAYFH